MNRKIGMFSSVINLIAIIGFAVSMQIGFNNGSYFFSMFIAFSFVPMMWAYAYFSERKYKLAGYISAGFAAMYATIILLVYFAQLTTVHLSQINMSNIESVKCMIGEMVQRKTSWNLRNGTKSQF